jgi:hypothetical protein
VKEVSKFPDVTEVRVGNKRADRQLIKIDGLAVFEASASVSKEIESVVILNGMDI